MPLHCFIQFIVNITMYKHSGVLLNHRHSSAHPSLDNHFFYFTVIIPKYHQKNPQDKNNNPCCFYSYKKLSLSPTQSSLLKLAFVFIKSKITSTQYTTRVFLRTLKKITLTLYDDTSK